MGKVLAVTGNAGPKIRSDCQITLELLSEGGIFFELSSKVKALYGESIKSQVHEILAFFEITNARITIDDSGALPFVIAARVEAAIKQLIETTKEFLLPSLPGNSYPTSRDRFRYSRLYLPGNNPSLMINAGLHSADGIILDLEDSVAPGKKDEARILVRNALRSLDFYGAERMVRINQGERALDDLLSVIPTDVNLVIIPKCEYAEQVTRVDNEIKRLCASAGINHEVYLMPVIETAMGVENAFQLAASSKSVVAIAIGLEDYTADLGVQRTAEGKESFYARTRLVVAAKAAGIQAIDSVFSDIDDMAALQKNVAESKALGFEGMGCIHPRQIQVIKRGFAPDSKEIEKAKLIILAFEEAKAKGLGVVALGSKMIDPPVVARAQRLVNQAMALGLLSEKWMDEPSLQV
jgi:citrate lyase subunit beta/citryl-CoA lyase